MIGGDLRKAVSSGMARLTRAESLAEAIMAQVDADLVLRLERESVRIPSLTYEEQECARYFAAVMRELGFDQVDLLEVEDPYGSGARSLQPVGWLKGADRGPSMMLNGHMDHVPVVGTWDRDPFSGDFVDGYIHGRGAHDDKGGIVAAIGAAVALRRAGIKLSGDLMVCPVMGHKSGGIGTRALLARGLRPDYCINTESSGLGIASKGVGVLKFLLHARAKPIHFRQVEQKRDWMDPFEQIAEVVRRLGRAMQPLRPGGWMSFTPADDLPGYPQLKYDDILGHYARTNRVTLEAQVRLVPGQSADTIRADLVRLMERLRGEMPGFDVEVEVPPKTGQYAGWDFPPYAMDDDAPLVRALASAHEKAAGRPAVVGAGPRLGAVGDANILAAHGVQVVQYGPGSSRDYAQWPTPDERVKLDDIVTAAKAMAFATAMLCQA